MDNDFSPVPLRQGEKRPAIDEWSRLCEEQPTEKDLKDWAGGSYNIGVALGFKGLVALDIDTDDHRIIEAIIGVTPHAIVAKRGDRGFTAFYRMDEPAETRGFNIGGKRVLDFLSTGRQTVIPPSLHPRTGREYVYTTALGLGDILPHHLEALPPDIIERLEAALVPLGYQRPPPKSAAAHDYDGGDWLHDKAMADFDSWVPHLGIDARRLANGKWRGKALWRGGDGLNVSFAPQGILDFVEERGFNPTQVVQAALGLDGWDAYNWLGERFGQKPLQRIHLTSRVKEEAQPQTDDDLPVITGAELWDADVTEPWMLVPNLFQVQKVNNLVGDSGLGKSLLLLSLFMCIAAGREEWFGVKLPHTGYPCVFFTAEENKGDAKKRLHKLAGAMGISREELKNLHIIAMGGAVSTILGEADTKGKVSATKLWRKLEALVRNVQPIALGVDPVGEVLDGDDINKRTVRSFMALLRPLAEEMAICVILASHPSMAGIANKTGRFGNVAWRASFRGAAHFYREGELGEVDDGRRTLVGEKVQDGKPGFKLEFAFNQDGVLERVDRPVVKIGGLSDVFKDEYDFLAMLDKCQRMGETPLNNQKSGEYAPKMFARLDGLPQKPRSAVMERVKRYECAMGSLKVSYRIRAVDHGPKSRGVKRIERVPPGSNQPSDNENDEAEE